MKSIYVVAMVAILIGAMKSESCAQKISTLEDFGKQVEKLWEVIIPIPPNPNHPSGLIYAPLKSGIAVLSVDGQSIYCYDFNGQLKWQAPGIQINSSNGALYSSAAGEYLYLSYPIHEDAFTSAVYNADGQLLWSAIYDSPFVVSPSGNYLISMYDGLDQSMPLTILDIVSGRILWQINLLPSHPYWQAAAGQNDKMAYYNAGSLRLYDLKTGHLIWAKNVEAEPKGDVGELHVSLEGNVISYSNLKGAIDNEQRVIYFFNENGELVWRRTQPFIPNKTNGGLVGGISEDGEFVNINDLSDFSIYTIKSQKKLLTITENPPSGITMFTQEAIAFYPWKEGTRVMTLTKYGTIKNDYTLNQFIDFRSEKRSLYFNKVQNDSQFTAMLIELVNNQFALSKFNLKLQ